MRGLTFLGEISRCCQSLSELGGTECLSVVKKAEAEGLIWKLIAIVGELTLLMPKDPSELECGMRALGMVSQAPLGETPERGGLDAPCQELFFAVLERDWATELPEFCARLFQETAGVRPEFFPKETPALLGPLLDRATADRNSLEPWKFDFLVLCSRAVELHEAGSLREIDLLACFLPVGRSKVPPGCKQDAVCVNAMLIVQLSGLLPKSAEVEKEIDEASTRDLARLSSGIVLFASENLKTGMAPEREMIRKYLIARVAERVSSGGIFSGRTSNSPEDFELLRNYSICSRIFGNVRPLSIPHFLEVASRVDCQNPGVRNFRLVVASGVMYAMRIDEKNVTDRRLAQWILQTVPDLVKTLGEKETTAALGKLDKFLEGGVMSFFPIGGYKLPVGIEKCLGTEESLVRTKELQETDTREWACSTLMMTLCFLGKNLPLVLPLTTMTSPLAQLLKQ